MSSSDTSSREFLFLLCSSRIGGNSEQLARRAAGKLSADSKQEWVRLQELAMPAIEDKRHSTESRYTSPSGATLDLLTKTLSATDIVFVAPLYWYSLPAAAKLYLDHWSGWMRLAEVQFKERMAQKIMWAISSYSDEDPRVAEPLMSTLRLTASYMGMKWGGSILGRGNRPGDVYADLDALACADRLFTVTGNQA